MEENLQAFLVEINQEEKEALAKRAHGNLRAVKQEARAIIRKALFPVQKKGDK